MKESKYLKDTVQNIEKLLTIPLMKEFDINSLSSILKQSKVYRYDDGEIIFKQGEAGPWLYFLLSGKVRVIKDGEDLATLQRKGEVFGEMGILTASYHSVSATAIGDTTCLAMNSSLIDKFSPNEKLAFSCILYRVLAEVISERLRRAGEDIVRLKKENEDLKARLGA